jgi:hypothetical protein
LASYETKKARLYGRAFLFHIILGSGVSGCFFRFLFGNRVTVLGEDYNQTNDRGEDEADQEVSPKTVLVIATYKSQKKGTGEEQ